MDSTQYGISSYVWSLHHDLGDIWETRFLAIGLSLSGFVFSRRHHLCDMKKTDMSF